MDIGASFGLWIKKRRKALDLTQSALAELAGCSTAMIEKIEADQRRPSLQLADLLADALEIPESERTSFLKVARGQKVVERLAVVPFPPQAPRPSSLPVSPTPLIGRQPELVEMARLLGDPDCRLLTLVGPGGIGKTRLALQAAANQQPRFVDGVFFVPLVGVSAAEFMPPAIAESLGLTFSGPASPRNQLLNFLVDKKLLLLLDNYEHLITSIDLVREILSQACDVKMLITSREPLGVRGEWLFEVQGLPVPRAVTDEVETNSSVALFIQTVRRAGLGSPQGVEELAAVVDICRLVGGMPLGIELAASWSRVIGFEEIASEIRRNMAFLSATMHGIPERHRSLRAVFDHSWVLLDSDEQQVLQRLSVFRGGFTRQAAEHVATASLGQLAGLVAKSLVSRPELERYALHEAVRQFAAAHLAASSELGLIRDRHCDYYLFMLGEQEQRLKSAAQWETIRQLTREFDNVREAWSWAVEQQKFGLIRQTLRSLGWMCDIVGWMQDGIDQLEPVVQALKAEATENPEYQATLGIALAQQGLLHFRQGYFDRALAAYDESLTWLRPLGDLGIMTDSLIWSGIILNLFGDIEQSQARLAEGLVCAQAAGDNWSVAWAIFNEGFIDSLVGKYEAGYSQMLAGLAKMRELGDPSCIALGLNFISPTAVLLSRLDEAEAFLNESLSWTNQVGDMWGMGTAYRNLGLVSLTRGDLVRARLQLRKSLNIFSQVVTGWDIVLTLDYLGRVSLAEGDLAGAKEIYLEALRLAVAVRTTPLATDILVGLARLDMQVQAFETALLLATSAAHNPASTQETKDAAVAVAKVAESQLSAEKIRMVKEHAAGLSLEALAALILSGKCNASLVGSR